MSTLILKLVLCTLALMPGDGDAELAAILEPIRKEFDLPALAGAIVTTEGFEAAAVGVRRIGSDRAVTVDDQWQLGSCTKAMHATLAAILVEDGAITWETTIGESFPDLAIDEAYRDVTLRQLLMHRGGVQRGYPTVDDTLKGTRAQRLAMCAEVLSAAPAYEPGSAFRYSNMGYVISGAMIEQATDTDWETLMKSRVFRPLRMSKTGFGVPGRRAGINRQPWGHRNGVAIRPDDPAADNALATGPGGRVFAPMRDWAAFASEHLRGTRRDTPLLSFDRFVQLHTPQADSGYAMGWFVRTDEWPEGDTLVHSGSNGRWNCLVRLCPQGGFGVLVATNTVGEGIGSALKQAANALAEAHREQGTEATPARRVFEDRGRSWHYDVHDVRGWTLYVEASVAEDRALVGDIRSTLDDRLGYIEKTVPKGLLPFLKSIPIWVSDEPTYPLREGERGVIPFHRSPGWLRAHGMNPHMAPGVHFINPRPIMYEHRVFQYAPETMLHELAHAYHNIELGLDHPGIRDSYEHAKGAGLYQRVPDRGSGDTLVEAYAATNQEEYFAELTEAYFGTNDWFPRNRAELLEYDPRGHEMIRQAWGVEAPEGTPGGEPVERAIPKD